MIGKLLGPDPTAPDLCVSEFVSRCDCKDLNPPSGTCFPMFCTDNASWFCHGDGYESETTYPNAAIELGGGNECGSGEDRQCYICEAPECAYVLPYPLSYDVLTLSTIEIIRGPKKKNSQS